jgi:hypothetical protein
MRNAKGSKLDGRDEDIRRDPEFGSTPPTGDLC